MTRPDGPTILAHCPVCLGPLTVAPNGSQCEEGHSFDAGETARAQAQALVRALWTAVRAVEDRAHAARELSLLTGPRVGRDRQADADFEVASYLRSYIGSVEAALTTVDDRGPA